MVRRFIEKIDNPDVVMVILKNWINDENINDIFSKYDIDKNFFVTNFGLKILDYFVLVFSGKAELGNCPYIEKFLEYLDEKRISVGELFLICSGLKKSILDFLIKDDLPREDLEVLFNDIYTIFDKNLSEVLNKFEEKHF